LKPVSNACNNAAQNVNNTNSTSTSNTNSHNNIHGQKRHLNSNFLPRDVFFLQALLSNSFKILIEEQAQFNKFVREEVSKKFGEDFLLQHEVNQLESSIMELIKCKLKIKEARYLINIT
jgi:hypothetical protein